MKKSLVLMAMAGVALASCVNDVADVAQNQEQKKSLVSFQAPVVYDNATSRYQAGEIADAVYPTDEKFMVAARVTASTWEGGAEFWQGFKEVSYDPTHLGWKTSDNYYWPSNPLSFVAYSPAGLPAATLESVAYTNSGWSFTNFVVPTNQTNTDDEGKIDLMYSSLIEGQTGNSTSGGYYGVPIQFKHALSSIHFIVKKADGVDVPVRLKSIKLNGVKNKGSFNGTNWTAATDAVSTEYVSYNVATATETNDEGLLFDFAIKHVGDNGGNSFLLMPQSLTGVTMTVEYFVNNKYNITTPAISLYNLPGLHNSITYNVQEWEPGKKYIYVLNYAALANDLIYFAPSVDQWQNVGININLN